MRKRRKTMATRKDNEAVGAARVSDDVSSDDLKTITRFFKRLGVSQTIAPQHDAHDSFSNLVGGVLKVISIERGKISCLLDVKAPVMNVYGGMHGGAVGSVAERVAIACARTVVAENTDLFLGELGISYLSAAPRNAEVIIDGHVVRRGRNITVVAVDFRVKKTGRLAFLSRATFYNMPVSSL